MIINDIDNGNAFEWGNTSEDYAKNSLISLIAWNFVLMFLFRKKVGTDVCAHVEELELL